MMSADQLLADGKVEEALAELQKQVRAKPADAKLRVFLFQLLSVQGAWERALNQLNVAGEMDPITLAMVQTYREAIRCEMLRAEIFAGTRSPLIFGQPDEWLALLTQALRLSGEGQHAAAAEMRDKAFAAAPATSGKLSFESRQRGNEPESQEQAFAWLADADSRLGPVLEAIINGKYYWAPVHRIRQIDIEAPEDLRDVVWMPAHFTWANGGENVGLIPTRYCGSEKSSDPLIRLARKTDWQEVAAETFAGIGQRMLATDGGEFSLMDIRRIELNVEADTSGTSAAHG